MEIKDDENIQLNKKQIKIKTHTTLQNKTMNMYMNRTKKLSISNQYDYTYIPDSQYKPILQDNQNQASYIHIKKKSKLKNHNRYLSDRLARLTIKKPISPKKKQKISPFVQIHQPKNQQAQKQYKQYKQDLLRQNKKQYPGPGSYNLSKPLIQSNLQTIVKNDSTILVKINSVNGTANFKSNQSKLNSIYNVQQLSNPGPGQYKYNINLIQKNNSLTKQRSRSKLDQYTKTCENNYKFIFSVFNKHYEFSQSIPNITIEDKQHIRPHNGLPEHIKNMNMKIKLENQMKQFILRKKLSKNAKQFNSNYQRKRSISQIQSYNQLSQNNSQIFQFNTQEYLQEQNQQDQQKQIQQNQFIPDQYINNSQQSHINNTQNIFFQQNNIKNKNKKLTQQIRTMKNTLKQINKAIISQDIIKQKLKKLTYLNKIDTSFIDNKRINKNYTKKQQLYKNFCYFDGSQHQKLNTKYNVKLQKRNQVLKKILQPIPSNQRLFKTLDIKSHNSAIKSTTISASSTIMNKFRNSLTEKKSIDRYNRNMLDVLYNKSINKSFQNIMNEEEQNIKRKYLQQKQFRSINIH